MDKKILPTVITLIGLLLIGYGFIRAPLPNEAEIRSIYRCDRLTEEYLDTDKYCSDPTTAPETKRGFANSYVYSGIAVSVFGAAYVVINRRQYK